MAHQLSFTAQVGETAIAIHGTSFMLDHRLRTVRELDELLASLQLARDVVSEVESREFQADGGTVVGEGDAPSPCNPPGSKAEAQCNKPGCEFCFPPWSTKPKSQGGMNAAPLWVQAHDIAIRNAAFEEAACHCDRHATDAANDPAMKEAARCLAILIRALKTSVPAPAEGAERSAHNTGGASTEVSEEDVERYAICIVSELGKHHYWTDGQLVARSARAIARRMLDEQARTGRWTAHAVRWSEDVSRLEGEKIALQKAVEELKKTNEKLEKDIVTVKECHEQTSDELSRRYTELHEERAVRAKLTEENKSLAAKNESLAGALQEWQVETERLKADREQLGVQLAGCGAAALGWSRGEQKAIPGDYGWSPSYGDVVALRDRHEAITAANPMAKALDEALLESRSVNDRANRLAGECQDLKSENTAAIATVNELRAKLEETEATNRSLFESIKRDLNPRIASLESELAAARAPWSDEQVESAIDAWTVHLAGDVLKPKLCPWNVGLIRAIEAAVKGAEKPTKHVACPMHGISDVDDPKGCHQEGSLCGAHKLVDGAAVCRNCPSVDVVTQATVKRIADYLANELKEHGAAESVREEFFSGGKP